MNLDREIAEKVMGWKAGTSPGSMPWYPPEAIHNRSGGVLNLPKYSTNIQHAMEVEAEMFRRGFTCEIYHDQFDHWNIDFWKKDSFHGKTICESLPEAICRAALAALEDK